MSVSAVDIVIPCFKPNLHLLTRCLQKLEEHTDVPHSILVVGDGFIPEDAVVLRKLLAELTNPHQLVHSHVVTFPQPVYLQRCVTHALSFLSPEAQIAVFLPPNLHLVDPAWFGKVQEPLMKDGLAAAVFFGCEQYDYSVEPARVEHAPNFFPAVAVSRRFLSEANLSAGEWGDLPMKIASSAAVIGCTCWAVQSVSCESYTAVAYAPPRPASAYPGKKVGITAGTDPRHDR